MGDQYFDLATSDHFWIRRRFDVLRKLLGPNVKSKHSVAEIGCGHGLVQKQYTEHFGVPVDGFDLNEVALRQSVARGQTLYYYNVNERSDAFRNKYDIVILFDVIEHIQNPSPFIDSVTYMVKSGGLIVINVPALQCLYSGYDKLAGHYRRYNIKTLTNLFVGRDLSIIELSYWGATLLPIVVLRKMIFEMKRHDPSCYRLGFASENTFVNRMLYVLSGAELIPQRRVGSSLMAIVQTQLPTE